MSQPINNFYELRRAIRQAGKQYRRNDDNSESLFHPASGFIYAYDIPAVEAALDSFEASLPSELQDTPQPPVSMEERIEIMGKRILAHHDSMEARDFARTVLAYMLTNPAQSGDDDDSSLFRLPGKDPEDS